MNAELIPLDLILPNPFQVRDKEDPEHVAKVAASIAAEGLLQDPVGRRLNGRVELAFGHTRLAAYRLLQYRNGSGYGALPVKIRDLTDEQLFVYAVRENEDRADLTPIERARAMVTYREKFGHTSKEIAERAKEKTAEADRQNAQHNRELSAAFLWQVAAPLFAVAFAGVKAGVLPYLAKAIERWHFKELELPSPPHARDELTRRYIAQQVLTDHLSYNDLALGPAHVGSELAGVATAWGIRLPDDWAQIAEKFGSVSAETESVA